MADDESTYDPTANLPAGRILDVDTHRSLMDAWIAKGSALTDSEVEAIVGTPLDTVQIPRSFPTGEHPHAVRARVDPRYRARIKTVRGH